MAHNYEHKRPDMLIVTCIRMQRRRFTQRCVNKKNPGSVVIKPSGVAARCWNVVTAALHDEGFASSCRASLRAFHAGDD